MNKKIPILFFAVHCACFGASGQADAAGIGGMSGSRDSVAFSVGFHEPAVRYAINAPSVGFNAASSPQFPVTMQPMDMKLQQVELNPYAAFYRNPYASDYRRGGMVSRWDSGGVAGVGLRTTMPGLMTVESASITMSYDFGKITLSGSVGIDKYYLGRGLIGNYNIGGAMTYRVSDRFSLNVFGKYYKHNYYLGPAAVPYMGSSGFGAYADMQFGDYFGMEVGASHQYSPYLNRWVTVPIAAPYVKLGGNNKVSVDLGYFIGTIIDNAFNGGRYYNSGNPSMAPPIAPMPPVR